jgi:two-component system chemotaxis response regulator CheY
MAFDAVLIVDDSSTSRMIIQRCIEMAGLKVGAFRFAENGLEALAMLRESAASAKASGDARQAISLVVTDINMPKMDGATFIRLMRADSDMASIPAIVVSSVASGESDAELLSLGAAAVVKKPVSPAKMLQAFGGLA